MKTHKGVKSTSQRLFAVMGASLLLVIAGCSSSSSSGSGTLPTGSSASTDAGLEQAKALIAKTSTPPAAINVTAPHSKPIPTDISVAYINCGVPTCTYIANALSDAAAVLGWKFTSLQTNGTPVSVKAAWASLVRQPPTAVITSGFPRVVYETELKALVAEGVGIFSCCTTDPASPDLILNLAGPAQQAVQGDIMAAWMAVQTQGKLNALYVNVPDYAILDSVKTEFQAKVPTYCSGCTSDSIDIPITALGATGINTIVSYLRAHPSVNYIGLSVDALGDGLTAAIKAAGLNVPFIGQGGGPVNRDAVASGTQGAEIEFPNYEFFWNYMDAIARWKAGESVEPDNLGPNFFLITPDNAKSTSPTIIPDLKAQYSKLWGRS